MAKCVGIEPFTLVMDLEGTDGRERGEVTSLGLKVLFFCVFYPFLVPVNGYCYFQDDTTFEKQSALFALAVADIVLINM